MRAVMTTIVLIATGLASANAASVQWRSGTVELDSQTPAEREQALTNLLSLETNAQLSAPRHAVVVLDRRATALQRGELAGSGVALLDAVGDRTFFAVVAPREGESLVASNIPYLEAIYPVERDWKLHPAFLNNEIPSWAIVEGAVASDETHVAAYLLFHRDVDLAGASNLLTTRHGAVVVDTLESINGLVIELPLANVPAVADEDAVRWIEPPLPQFFTMNDSNRVITQADIVQAAPYDLDGAGVNVLVYDAGTALESHNDFGGRLAAHDNSGLHTHATHVAGTVGGNGANSGGTFRGMAPAVTIESYGFEYNGLDIFLYSNPGDIESDYDDAINLFGSVIANNSIGTNTATNGFPCDITGDYGVTANLIDSIVTGSLGVPFRIVWANGNERQTSNCGNQYYTTAPPACAKNHITVGALNSNNDSVTSFTSWGPCDDGRMKPDVSAPGCQSNADGGVTSCSSSGNYSTLCGTSMASPTVAGLSALFIQDYRVQYPGQGDPLQSTVKSILAHTATDVGDNVGPDHQTGFGSVRIQRAIDFMRSGNFLVGEVDQDGFVSLIVEVEEGDPLLEVTLAWDDAPATPNITNALVNDLDIRLFDPNNEQHFPWTLNPADPGAPATQDGPDRLNNLEQVTVTSPEAGAWRLEIFGFNVPEGPQNFSVAASPVLLPCSSQGLVALDGNSYACDDTVGIQVVDCDLNGDDSVAETTQVVVSSTSEPAGEVLILTESDVDEFDFIGEIPISSLDAAGVLLVAPGDEITVTYIDADDGDGGTNIARLDTASLDCVGPVISAVSLSETTPESAVIGLETDEPALPSVSFGLSCDNLDDGVDGTQSGTTHEVVVTGLAESTRYYFTVSGEDGVGNVSTDDNGGDCYSFITPLTVLFDAFEVSSGWTVGAPDDDATTGIWERTDPEGTAAQPEDDHTPVGVNCFVTDGDAGFGLGDFDIDGGKTTLTSPVLDLTKVGNPSIDYWRWYSNNQGAAPNSDVMLVQVTDNGVNWVTVEEVTENAGDWVNAGFVVSDFVTPTSTVQVRFIASDEGAGSLVEAGVDDFRIVGVVLSDGDFNSSGTVDLFDVAGLFNCFGQAAVHECQAGDTNGDGTVDLGDVESFMNLLTGP